MCDVEKVNRVNTKCSPSPCENVCSNVYFGEATQTPTQTQTEREKEGGVSLADSQCIK